MISLILFLLYGPMPNPPALPQIGLSPAVISESGGTSKCDNATLNFVFGYKFGEQFDLNMDAKPLSVLTPQIIKRQRDAIACLRETLKASSDQCQREVFGEALDGLSKQTDVAERRMIERTELPARDSDNLADRAYSYMRTHTVPELKCRREKAR